MLHLTNCVGCIKHTFSLFKWKERTEGCVYEAEVCIAGALAVYSPI